MKVKLKEVLNRELKQRNISLNEIAKRCGIPQSVLHGWMNGALPAGKNMEHIQRLSNFLGLSLNSLLFNAKDSKNDGIVLATMEFKDDKTTYRLTVEKIRKD